jgi:hypothetical protein
MPTLDPLAPRRPPRKAQRPALQLARAVDDGRGVAEALRHLDVHGSERDAVVVAEALARFLVSRCESHHAGWQAVRQVVVDTAAEVPWEKCARRAVPLVVEDLLRLSGAGGRTPLRRAQHVAAGRRAEEIADYADPVAVLAELDLAADAIDAAEWREALAAAVSARSREQLARSLKLSLAAS